MPILESYWRAMYQFNYQHLIPEGKPFVTCIVPTDWLSRNLPTMGGSVTYADKRDPMSTYTHYVFEFTDLAQTGEPHRTICLDIHCLKAKKSGQMPVNYTKLFDIPVQIHCRAIDDHDANNDWCIEVVLLNHFFGSHALSASMNNIYLDYADIETVMQMSSDFNFDFEVGDKPFDILYSIKERLSTREFSSIFGMMFCNERQMKLAHIVEATKAMAEYDSEDFRLIFSDVAVDQDKTLISLLIGR